MADFSKYAVDDKTFNDALSKYKVSEDEWASAVGSKPQRDPAADAQHRANAERMRGEIASDQDKEGSSLQTIKDLGLHLGQGFLAGGGDELYGGARSALTDVIPTMYQGDLKDQSYNEAHQDAENALNEASARSPWATGLGAPALQLGAGVAAGAAGVPAYLASRGAQAATGTALGGAAGYANAPEGGKFLGAAEGAGIGLAMGVLPSAGAALSSRFPRLSMPAKPGFLGGLGERASDVAAQVPALNKVQPLAESALRPRLTVERNIVPPAATTPGREIPLTGPQGGSGGVESATSGLLLPEPPRANLPILGVDTPPAAPKQPLELESADPALTLEDLSGRLRSSYTGTEPAFTPPDLANDVRTPAPERQPLEMDEEHPVLTLEDLAGRLRSSYTGTEPAFTPPDLANDVRTPAAERQSLELPERPSGAMIMEAPNGKAVRAVREPPRPEAPFPLAGLHDPQPVDAGAGGGQGKWGQFIHPDIADSTFLPDLSRVPPPTPSSPVEPLTLPEAPSMMPLQDRSGQSLSNVDTAQLPLAGYHEPMSGEPAGPSGLETGRESLTKVGGKARISKAVAPTREPPFEMPPLASDLRHPAPAQESLEVPPAPEFEPGAVEHLSRPSGEARRTRAYQSRTPGDDLAGLIQRASSRESGPSPGMGQGEIEAPGANKEVGSVKSEPKKAQSDKDSWIQRELEAGEGLAEEDLKAGKKVDPEWRERYAKLVREAADEEFPAQPARVRPPKEKPPVTGDQDTKDFEADWAGAVGSKGAWHEARKDYITKALGGKTNRYKSDEATMVKKAWDKGFQDVDQLQQATGIPKKQLHTILSKLDYDGQIKLPRK